LILEAKNEIQNGQFCTKRKPFLFGKTNHFL